MLYALTDREWAFIQPILPNRPRGGPRELLGHKFLPNGSRDRVNEMHHDDVMYEHHDEIIGMVVVVREFSVEPG